MIIKLMNRLDLYCNDLNAIGFFEEKQISDYEFRVIKDISEIFILDKLISERGPNYRKVIIERLESKTFLCFSFIEKSTGKLAYSRWLRFDSFYHDGYRKKILLSDKEAFTLDSYTPIEFRSKGLHKEMNKRMLNYCKSILCLNKVYMVIFRGNDFLHLHNIVKEIGYKKIHSYSYLNFSLYKKLIILFKKHV